MPAAVAGAYFLATIGGGRGKFGALAAARELIASLWGAAEAEEAIVARGRYGNGVLLAVDDDRFGDRRPIVGREIIIRFEGIVTCRRRPRQDHGIGGAFGGDERW